MIPEAYIVEWGETIPWINSEQLEQDLVISRALVNIFSVSGMNEMFAFRGGTSLYKLYLPPLRYSEDIDLVQLSGGPINEGLRLIQSTLDHWLGEPQRLLKQGRIVLKYRFTAASGKRLRLKIEINSREHFSVFPIEEKKFSVDSQWFSGATKIPTYCIDELLGTKLRALYQRRKSRDLFDLWTAFENNEVDTTRLLNAFSQYMAHGNHSASRAEFEANLFKKMTDPIFVSDILPLLPQGIEWPIQKAHQMISDRLISCLPGEPWKGLKV